MQYMCDPLHPHRAFAQRRGRACRICSEPAPQLRPMLQPIYDMPLEAGEVFRAKGDFPRLILMDYDHFHPFILGIIIILNHTSKYNEDNDGTKHSMGGI